MDRSDSRRRAASPEPSSFAPTRRAFLSYLGGAVAAGLMPEVLSACAIEGSAPPDATENAAAAIGATGLALGTSFTITRPRDNLVLTMTPMNLELDLARKNLVRMDATKPTYLIAGFGSLHLDEPSGALEPVVEHRAAGPSQLVFRLPDNTVSVPMKLDQILLLCTGSQLNVAVNAISDQLAAGSNAARKAAYDFSKPSESLPVPDPTVTALEIPYRLVLSPNELGRFAHAAKPVVSSAGRVELWNTRLGVADPATNGVDEHTAANRTMRAIYTRDFATGDGPINPYSTGERVLTWTNRGDIVKQSGNFTSMTPIPSNAITPPPPPAPPSIDVDNLVLTPMGATMDVRARWESGFVKAPRLVSWKHRTSMGRDAYMQATFMGYLFPFGLPAVAIQTVWRKLESGDARLWARWQIHLLKTSVEYGPLDSTTGLPPVAHRGMPFRRITVKGPTTFDIDSVSEKTQNDCTTASNTAFIEAQHNGQQIMLPIEAIDWKGNKISFSMPLVWADNKHLDCGVTRYNGYTPNGGAAALSTLLLNRQRIAVAPSKKDYTTLEVAWMQLNVAVASPPSGPPTFYPFVRVLGGALEIGRHLAGVSAPDAPPSAADRLFTYHDDYTQLPTTTRTIATAVGLRALDKDSTPAAQMVLRMVDDWPTLTPSTTGLPITFPAGSGGRGGGIVQPNTVVTGVSMGLGAVADISSGQFDPKAYFDKIGKLFGLIEITDLIPGKQLLSAAPQFVTESLHLVERYSAEIDRLHTLLKTMPADVQATLNAQIAAANQQLGKDIDLLNTAASQIEGLVTAALGPGDLSQKVSDTLNALGVILTTLQTALRDDSLYPNLASASSGLRRGALTQLNKVAEIVNQGAAAITTAITSLKSGMALVRDLKAKMEWRPTIPLTTIPPAPGTPYTEVPGGLLTLKQENPLFLSVQIDGKGKDGAGGATLFASLDNFYLNFPPHVDQARVQLQFAHIFFSKAPNAKAEIDVKLNDIQFLKELSFIQDIRKLIPLDGFSDPPHIDVDEEGIHASFSLGLPNLSFGILSFENLKLSAGLEVPFLGEITFNFAFCDRDHPFTVTVAMLGGGGYFMLEMATDGSGAPAFRRLEASIDVCAQISINIGVASGSISISAGFRFTYDAATGTHLTGFVDLRGALDVLGLINISIEAKLELTYDFDDNSVVGSCTLTVEVDIAFFSKSVDLHFEKRFGGSGPAQKASNEARMLPNVVPAQTLAPSFQDLMSVTGDPWVNEYLTAFG